MRLRLTFQLLATIFLAVSSANELAAQTSVTGEVAGTVVDYSGAVVAGAAVSLKSEARGELENRQADGLGQFRFALLRPGTYTLTVTATRFETSGQRVTVNLGRTTTVTIRLAIGTVTTTVEVTEQPPMLDARNGNLATTYQTNQLASLPAPGGDITSYAYTAPGIVMNTGSGWGNFSAFGLPSISNQFTTNGNDNMDALYNMNNSGASNLSLGTNELQEVVVVTNGYSAQYVVFHLLCSKMLPRTRTLVAFKATALSPASRKQDLAMTILSGRVPEAHPARPCPYTSDQTV